MWSWFRRWRHHSSLWRRVRKHGWTAVYVGDYRSFPTWAYSIGFDETLNQPEVIVFDIPQDSANSLMWKVFRALTDGALVLEDGLDWTDAPEGRCVWRKVHPSQIDGPDGWFTFASRRRAERTGRRFGLEGFQLVLSDENGLMPWDDDYDEQLRPRQPALWLPGDETGRAWEMNPAEAEARRLIRERGWTSLPIEGPEFNWAYTIGLHEALGTPDLITFAPEAKPIARMLVDVRAHLRAGSLALSDGLRWDGLGWEVCFRLVHETQYLGFNWFYLAKEIREERTGKREPFPAYQVFVPDDAGRYPWDERCDPAFADVQPQLFLPLDVEPSTRRALAAVSGV